MKSHFEVLDGLRGTAALSVLLFHILEITTPDLAHNPLRHAHLAVDFFFALSGFVLGHAYDARLSADAPSERRLSLKSFFLRRLIRLHPMVIVSMIMGLLGFLFDPYDGSALGTNVSLSTLTLVFGLSLLLLPSPTLPDRFGETHSLNGPAWTLSQEYIANLAYGLFGRRLSRRALGALCAIGAIAVLLTALHFGNLGTGWAWSTYWAAFVRVTYPFFAGLLLYRLNIRFALPHSYAWLSLLLLAIFAAPGLGRFDAVYEALCVIAAFPLVICFGAGVGRLNGLSGSLCRLSGRLSYPVYIIHYPAVYVFAHWVWKTQPTAASVWLAAVLLYIGVIFAGWLLLKYSTLESAEAFDVVGAMIGPVYADAIAWQAVNGLALGSLLERHVAANEIILARLAPRCAQRSGDTTQPFVTTAPCVSYQLAMQSTPRLESALPARAAPMSNAVTVLTRITDSQLRLLDAGSERLSTSGQMIERIAEAVKAAQGEIQRHSMAVRIGNRLDAGAYMEVKACSDSHAVLFENVSILIHRFDGLQVPNEAAAMARQSAFGVLATDASRCAILATTYLDAVADLGAADKLGMLVGELYVISFATERLAGLSDDSLLTPQLEAYQTVVDRLASRCDPSRRSALGALFRERNAVCVSYQAAANALTKLSARNNSLQRSSPGD